MLSFPLTTKFTDALTLAGTWHHGQYRKVAPGEQASIPYLSHLLGVASIALEFGADETVAIAAVLHDALEDGPQFTGRDASSLRGDIVATFGEDVARLVDGATDATPKAGEAKAPWAERKEKYLRHLAGEAPASLLVSASDKLHNARSILSDVLTRPEAEREAYFTRFNQGRDGTLQYYRLLVDAYRAAPGGQGSVRLQGLFMELDRTVTTLEEACGLRSDDVRGLPLLASAAQNR